MKSERDLRLSDLISVASSRGFFITGAESLTGGAVSAELTRIPGASKVFLGSFITYTDAFKQGTVHVSPALLQSQGAVDPEVCAQMVNGARVRASRLTGITEDRIISFSSTGEAGPETASSQPVGRVFTGLQGCDGAIQVLAWDFPGTREEIRNQTCDALIHALLEQIELIRGFPLS